MNLNETGVFMFNIARNFIIGLSLLPATISVMFLYMYFISDINILTGGPESVSDVIQVGYIVTKEDIVAIKELESVLLEIGFIGILTGCFFALIEIMLMIKRKVKRSAS